MKYYNINVNRNHDRSNTGIGTVSLERINNSLPLLNAFEQTFENAMHLKPNIKNIVNPEVPQMALQSKQRYEEETKSMTTNPSNNTSSITDISSSEPKEPIRHIPLIPTT